MVLIVVLIELVQIEDLVAGLIASLIVGVIASLIVVVIAVVIVAVIAGLIVGLIAGLIVVLIVVLVVVGLFAQIGVVVEMLALVHSVWVRKDSPEVLQEWKAMGKVVGWEFEGLSRMQE